VRHFLAGASGIRGNATQAAMAAGYAQKTAEHNAKVILGNVVVQAAIAAYHAKGDVSIERVVGELSRLAFSDHRAYLRWGPDGVTLTPSDALSDDAAAAVAEVSEHRTTRTAAGEGTGTVEERQIRFKLHDKHAALNTLLRHFKGMPESGGEAAVMQILQVINLAVRSDADLASVETALLRVLPATAGPNGHGDPRA